MDKLADDICRECKKPIRVAHTTPYEGDEEQTGCDATGWDGDRQFFIGWVCLDCAFEMANRRRDEPGKHGILSGPEFSFSYT